MNKRLLIWMLSCIPVLVSAQSITLKGKVVDEDGQPVSNATVQAISKKEVALTKEDGTFSLKLSDTANVRLEISHTGFLNYVVRASEDLLTIRLNRSVGTSEDVVVVGFGTARKKDLTGAVGVLSGKELEKIPVPNVAEALTGKIAGVHVTTTEGSPDADIKIRIRGGGSISQDNSPLYIVDGFRVSTINNIASSDIASITFLKDGSSTAIYGSSGANGVILITTKEGKAGKISVTANVYNGVRKLTRELEVLNPYEYVMYQYEIDQTTSFSNYYGEFSDLDIYKSQRGRNYQKEIFGRTANQQYYNVGISGGTKDTRFNLGLSRNDEDAIMLNSAYERNNINFKLNTNFNKKLSLDFNTRLSHMLIDGAGVNTGAGSNSKLRNSIKFAPTKGLRDFSNELLDDEASVNPEDLSSLFDPLLSTLNEYKKQLRINANLNVGLNWKILPFLTFRTEAGYEYIYQKTSNVWGPNTPYVKDKAGQPVGNIAFRDGSSWRVSNYFTLNKKDIFKHHDIQLVAGQEAISSAYNTTVNESRFFPVGMTAEAIMANMNFGTAIPTVTYKSMDERKSSYFGRVNYTILGRYIFTGTLRADGSSKFAEGNQWGYFPAAAFAWNLRDENFLQNAGDWLKVLKFRASLGTAGNDKIISNAWQLMYGTNNENKPYFPGETEAANFIPGSYLYNPGLKWEKTITRNLGLDFELFKSRITGSVEVYHNTTKDLLIQAPLPTSSGYSFQYQNFGQTSNKGIEFTFDANIINKRDFSLNVNFNIAFNKNNVDQFVNGESDFKTYGSGWNGSSDPLEDYLIKKGSPVGQMYGYTTDGMYGFDDFTFNSATRKWELNKDVPNNSSLLGHDNNFGPGSLKFKDISGPDGVPDGVIDSYDKTIIGNANPKHVGGFNIQSRFKGFDLSVFMNWSYGNDIYNANKLDYTSYNLTRKYQNLVTDMSLENRFTIIDPLTGMNVLYGSNANPERLKELNANASIWSPLHTRTMLHSWAVEDGSFLRLNNITIGYTFPAKWINKIGMSNLRLYATGYNLHVFTKYSGFDPEVDSRRGTPLTPGVDYSAYPKSRSFIAGVNITFK